MLIRKISSSENLGHSQANQLFLFISDVLAFTLAVNRLCENFTSTTHIGMEQSRSEKTQEHNTLLKSDRGFL